MLTARDSYRQPGVAATRRVAELPGRAGTQFDPQVVEALRRLLAAKHLSFGHADDADFEAELAFEHRVRDYARRDGASA